MVVMGLPTKAQQISAVMKFLDSEKNEGRSLEEIATDIVNGYHEALLSSIKKPAQPIRNGMLFKSPTDAKVWRVSWTDGDIVWLATDSSSYGYLGKLDDKYWQYCEEYRPKKRADGKLVEMTDGQIAEAWSHEEWSVGDKLSRSQRLMSFEIIATAPSSVLMRGSDGSLYSESSGNLKKYYRRETKVGDIEW